MLAEAKLCMVCTIGGTEIVLWELSSYAKPDELYGTALATGAAAAYAGVSINHFLQGAVVVACLTAIAKWGEPCAQ